MNLAAAAAGRAAEIVLLAALTGAVWYGVPAARAWWRHRHPAPPPRDDLMDVADATRERKPVTSEELAGLEASWNALYPGRRP